MHSLHQQMVAQVKILYLKWDIELLVIYLQILQQLFKHQTIKFGILITHIPLVEKLLLFLVDLQQPQLKLRNVEQKEQQMFLHQHLNNYRLLVFLDSYLELAAVEAQPILMVVLVVIVTISLVMVVILSELLQKAVVEVIVATATTLVEVLTMRELILLVEVQQILPQQGHILLVD